MLVIREMVKRIASREEVMTHEVDALMYMGHMTEFLSFLGDFMHRKCQHTINISKRLELSPLNAEKTQQSTFIVYASVKPSHMASRLILGCIRNAPVRCVTRVRSPFDVVLFSALTGFPSVRGVIIYKIICQHRRSEI